MRSAEVMATIWSAPNGSRTLTGKRDRKSTRLNSSHGYISYAVFCLKKKNNSLDSRFTVNGTIVHEHWHILFGRGKKTISELLCYLLVDTCVDVAGAGR